MNKSPSRKNPISPAEQRLSIILLSLLAITALGLFLLQNDYDPSRWRAQPARPAPDQGATAADPAETPPVDGLSPMTPLERYDAATLSDKIDGKAELYLSAGFKSLECRRYALADHPSQWMEHFVYDMGDYRNAFAVFSRQRRDQAQPLDLTPDAYRSTNGLFLVQGPYYLEIIGSEPSDPLMEKMMELARAFIAAHPVAKAVLDERALFPADNLAAGSITLTPENAFGFEPFNRIYTARYQIQGRTLTAFLSRRASADEARGLVQAYSDYLITYGGKRIEISAGPPSVVVIEILDTYEVIFSNGSILAGVHESEDLEQGLALAREISGNLDRKHHGR